jgi:hypothetical protein
MAGRRTLEVVMGAAMTMVVGQVFQGYLYFAHLGVNSHPCAFVMF